MEIELPFIHGLDELSPLVAYLVLYLVGLMAFKLLLVPFVERIRKKDTLKNGLGTLGLVAQRLMVFGLLLLAFLWALEELGLADGFYNMVGRLGRVGRVGNLPDFTLPSLEVMILGTLISLLLFIYFVITPAFVRRRNRS